MPREEKPNPSRQLDLRGVRCPLSWAKTKICLEQLLPGEELIVWLDDPKGAVDIPRAAESEGHAADADARAADGVWRIRIRV